MITNFEEVTADLNKEEIKFLPIVVDAFIAHKVNNTIYSNEIVSIINVEISKTGQSFKMNDVRLRKFVNYMRVYSILPVIGTSRGYYISYNPEEVEKQIKSLMQRANSTRSAAKGLLKILKKCPQNVIQTSLL